MKRFRPSGITEYSDIETRVYIGDSDLSSIDRLDADTISLSQDTSERAAYVAKKLPSGWPIGLERSLHSRSLPDISSGLVIGRLAMLGITYHDNSRDEILQRPDSEIGVIRLLTDMDGGLSFKQVETAVGLMGGIPKWRTAAARTRPFQSGHFTEFLDHDIAIPAFCDVLSGIDRPIDGQCGITRGSFVYFMTTLCHPLHDGNGRLARGLFQCAMKSDLGICSPIFPLGPLLEKNKPLLLDSLYRWQMDKDASPLVRLFCNCINAYCDLYEMELREI